MEPPKRGRQPKPKEEKSVRLNFSIPPELNARMEKYRIEEERSISYCIQKALDIWLKGKGY